MVSEVSMSREQWFAVNEVFLRHRRTRHPVRRKQMLHELRLAGVQVTSSELSQLARQFHFWECSNEFLQAD